MKCQLSIPLIIPQLTQLINVTVIRLFKCSHNTRNKKPSHRRDSARRRSLRHSRSFKVTDFDTNRKLGRNFLLMNNTALYPSRTVSKLLQIVGQIFRCRQGVSLFNRLVPGKLINSVLRNFKKLETSLVRTAKFISIS